MIKLEENEQLVLQRSRVTIYSFLARVYEKEVTLDFLQEYTSEKSPLLQMSGMEEFADENLTEGFHEMIDYLREIKGRDLSQVKLELDVEYANLFLGMVGKPPHPSESVYSTDAHLVMQKARDDVLAAYRNAGVDRAKEFNEPEDHIAIELQFMAYLCQKAVESYQKGEEAEAQKWIEMQKEFLNEHLSVWVPELVDDILESSKVGFYRGAAKITAEFIEMDRLELGPFKKTVIKKE